VNHDEPLPGSFEHTSPGSSEHIQIRWDDEREFVDWVRSVSANQEEFKTLAAHPQSTLYQAKAHVQKRERLSRAKNGVLKFLRQLQLGKIHHGTPG
jgi:hypothetical protein